MKQTSGFFMVVFLTLAAFWTIQAQDNSNFAADPYGRTGVGVYDPSFVPPLPAPGAAGISSFREEGIASWYGTEFEGHPTASGELFNPSQMTAAHPSLPFGTMLQVTNTQNRRQVIVRVNDRGPFVNTRIIDVSRAAAEVLDIISTGTAPVVVEIASEAAAMPSVTPPVVSDPWAAPVQTQPSTVYPVQPPAAPAQPYPVQPQVYPVDPYPVQPPALTNYGPAVVKPRMPPFGTTRRYRAQVGAYKVSKNAVEAFDRLKSLGLNPSYERYDDYYRVVIPGLRAEDIQYLAETLGSAGFREILVREE
jgi:rare lipoprotein A